MKKSLKMSVQIFGVAGLVVLAGCGDTPAVENIDLGAPVEVLDGAMEKTGDVMEKTGDAMKDGADAVTDEVMEKTGDAMEAGDKMIKDATEHVEGDGHDHAEDGDVMEKEAASDAANRNVGFEMPYTSPAGPHTMTVALTIADGVVTTAKATPELGASHPAVIKWQAAFSEGISEAVVGKSIDELQGIDAVGGASLTTEGFKEAVTKI